MWLWIRDGHADARICGSCGLCAYLQICGCGWKSYPHYPQTIFAKNGHFLGKPGSVFNSKCLKYYIVHPFWFYPSSGIENKNPKSQYFGQKDVILFYIWYPTGKYRHMAIPSYHLIEVITRKNALIVVTERNIVWLTWCHYLLDPVDKAVAKMALKQAAAAAAVAMVNAIAKAKPGCTVRWWVGQKWEQIGNVLSTSFARASHLAPLSHLTFS